MLLELSIQDLAIIDRLQLCFGAGFTIMTGETGAGKSIIIDGVNLLLGGRSDSTMVRSGAERAQIEGVFGLPADGGAWAELMEQEQLWGDERDRLVLAREIQANGRSVSRVNGRTVTLALLRQVSAGLVDIHGQTEHLSLLRVREHLNLLDRYAGLEPERAELAGLVHQLGAVRAELQALLQDERELARRADLLSYQIQEIRGAALRPGEAEELLKERTRLSNAEQLMVLAEEAYLLLEGPAGEMPAARDLVGNVVRALKGLAKVDPSQAALHETATQVGFQLDELGRALRDYREGIEFNPARLAAVEERIELIRRLQRKYGDSIEEIVAYAARAAADLDAISHSEERIEALQAQETALLHAIGRAGAALSARRRTAAVALAAAVERELADLRMSGARFEVELRWRPDEAGAYVPRQVAGLPADLPGRAAFDASGLDQVEFLISPNPGEPLKPMVKIASGGETSRLMLAIKTVLSLADQTPTLIFDEIDQGIGGRVGQMVGQKLWALSHAQPVQRQVICITHLPQLAGFGDEHYRVTKGLTDGRTTTHVQPLATVEARVSELAQMLGGDTPAHQQSGRELLDRVQSYRAGTTNPAGPA